MASSAANRSSVHSPNNAVGTPMTPAVTSSNDSEYIASSPMAPSRLVDDGVAACAQGDVVAEGADHRQPLRGRDSSPDPAGNSAVWTHGLLLVLIYAVATVVLNVVGYLLAGLIVVVVGHGGTSAVCHGFHVTSKRC